MQLVVSMRRKGPVATFVRRLNCTDVVERIFVSLHQKAEHGPDTVARRWKPAYDRFMRIHQSPYCLVRNGIIKGRF